MAYTFAPSPKARDEDETEAATLASGQYSTILPGVDVSPAFGKAEAPNADSDDTLSKAGKADGRLSLMARMQLGAQIRALLIVLGVSLVLSIFFVYKNADISALMSTQTQIASNVLMHSQRIGKATPNAVQGKVEAFKQLQESLKEFNSNLKVLTNGGDFNGRYIDEPKDDMRPMLKEVSNVWKSSNEASAVVLGLKNELTGFSSVLQSMKALTPLLYESTEQISTSKISENATPREISSASSLSMLTQRLARSANDFVSNEGVNPETSFLLGKDANTFSSIVDGLLNGSENLRLPPTKDEDTRAALIDLKQNFGKYKIYVREILDNLQKFVKAKQAEQLIFNENEKLKLSLTNLQKEYRRQQDSTNWSFWMMIVSGLVAVTSAGLIALALLRDSQNRTRGADIRRQESDMQRLAAQRKEEEAKATNDQNQAAILRLMNELQEVADGDLTVQATVSEDITGAIADSVNYTVEELRGLVGRVTKTAEEVTNASTQAQNISTELLSATEQQVSEIQGTSEAVLTMAQEITEVSNSANESADVALQSVAAAEQGATAVQNAIKGMDEIREQIQETSKRIKRLGESSQEIGEITELISDITEQTNVLALNAAIQAASAGEAGRGFSVVAEEVQRLAERSGEATKQIGALVRTIQTDTHDAVAAMEKSTQGVVEGAKLSDAAGAALADISRVSNRLAQLIQEISMAAQRQAASANNVAGNIQNILLATEQTQIGTNQTASSIQKLSMLAEELKNSVSRFRVT
jgi:twitching motility protein PilJ